MRRAVPFRLDRDTPNTIVIGAVSAYLAGTDITQHGSLRLRSGSGLSSASTSMVLCFG